MSDAAAGDGLWTHECRPDLPCAADACESASRGALVTCFDRRKICCIAHPWAQTAAGGFGAISRLVTGPAAWGPPLWFRWYVSDGHCGTGVDPEVVVEGSTALVMLGRCFKQVLVDDMVAWQRDVAEPIFPGPRVAPSCMPMPICRQATGRACATRRPPMNR